MDDSKIKVVSAEIVEDDKSNKPYYQIKYKKPGSSVYNIGFGSYQLDFVEEWLESCFEIVPDSEEENVAMFPVDMDDMQRNVMVELLNARKEATEENTLTARGFVAVIDALFYLVKTTGE